MYSTALPDDPSVLKALIGELTGELEAREQALRQTQAELVAKHDALGALQREIERLELLVATMRRAQYGRRSERFEHDLAQLELALEELQSTKAALTASEPLRATPARQPRRRPLPEHLPRQTQTLSPPHSACPSCGGELKHLGEDVSELLEYVPASFKVIRQVRPKLSCRCCDTIVQAAAPSRVIAGGLPGPGLMSHVLVAKYADHIPLYRQSAIYARERVELSRSTMAGWVGKARYTLAPLVGALRRYVLDTEKLHGDDTPIPVLAPGRGKTATARLWTYVRDERPAGSESAPAVWFAYSANRKGEHPQSHLKGFSGILQADAYAGFGALYERGRVQPAGCWAHVRRKFYEIAQAHDSPLAQEALVRIGALYAIEQEIRGQRPAVRREQRQARAGPLLEELYQWLRQTQARLSRKSALSVAIQYALKLWPALIRYRDDGRLEIDNNAAERALRAVALGRKNYLFAGSDSGGECAAAIYSLIGTCKLNGIDPEAYLRLVFERIGEHPINRIDELLPWNLADELTELAPRAAA